MTVTSWSLELVTGIITLVNMLFFSHHDSLEIITQILAFIHAFLYFVVIPGSYLLSTDVSKNLIVAHGWAKIFPFCQRPNRVAPIENEAIEMNNIPQHNEAHRQIVPIPVPTISGNVNIETSYKIY